MALQDITPPWDLQHSLRNGRQHSFTIYADEVDFYDIRRWMFLFGYSQSEAIRRMKDFRSKPPAFTLPNHHWNRVKKNMMSEGYDREAYAFLYNQKQKMNKAKKSRQIATAALRELVRTRDLVIDSEDFLHRLQITIELETLFSAAEEATTHLNFPYE
ncbi:uncharacterized protein FTOL_03869 [Fusarium torulosum]|uniref:Uncharacterized protein n=1 Tax=Fusarium torulosum TaxID=33205 RepID=A0AAE8M4M6_9HYPO|nr:uncharacterized protein FTOL_03869 [Fusarium torulosum]